MSEDLLAGHVRRLQRGLDEVNARVAAHEAGHQGATLPDIVGWLRTQWLTLNPAVKNMALIYALGLAIALGRWIWSRIRNPRPVPSSTFTSWAQ